MHHWELSHACKKYLKVRLTRCDANINSQTIKHILNHTITQNEKFDTNYKTEGIYLLYKEANKKDKTETNIPRRNHYSDIFIHQESACIQKYLKITSNL